MLNFVDKGAKLVISDHIFNGKKALIYGINSLNFRSSMLCFGGKCVNFWE